MDRFFFHQREINRHPQRTIEDLCSILRNNDGINQASSRESLLSKKSTLRALCRRVGWFGGPVPDVTVLRRGTPIDCYKVGWL